MAAHLFARIFLGSAPKPQGFLKLTEMFDEQCTARNPDSFKGSALIGGFWNWIPQEEKRTFWSQRQKGYIEGNRPGFARGIPLIKNPISSNPKYLELNGLCLYDQASGTTDTITCLEGLVVQAGDHLSQFLLRSGKVYRFRPVGRKWELDVLKLKYVCNAVMS